MVGHIPSLRVAHSNALIYTWGAAEWHSGLHIVPNFSTITHPPSTSRRYSTNAALPRNTFSAGELLFLLNAHRVVNGNSLAISPTIMRGVTRDASFFSDAWAA